MNVSLNIDPYYDSYGYDYINCWEYPVAGAAGFYDKENYFYYLLQHSLRENWGNVEPEFAETTRKLLYNLNLDITATVVDKSSCFIDAIKASLAHGHPVIVFPEYSALFYTNAYKLSGSGTHALVVSGYDSGKRVFTVNEPYLKASLKMQHIKGDPFFPLQVTEGILADIWENSVDVESGNTNSVFSIVPTVKRFDTSYVSLLQDFLSKGSMSNSNLSKMVSGYNGLIDMMKNSVTAIRVKYCGSIAMLFDIIQKKVLKAIDNENLCDEFAAFKDEYLVFRNTVLNKVLISALQDKALTDGQITKLVDGNTQKDMQLSAMLGEICLSGNKNVFVNFALGAYAYADSQQPQYPASNVVNGTWADLQDCWNSTVETRVHWIAVDLGEIRKISRYTIRHCPFSSYCLIDFELQGSNDNITWEPIADFRGNDEEVTVAETSVHCFRFIRLYITNPSQSDLIARLYQFEIWGTEESVLE